MTVGFSYPEALANVREPIHVLPALTGLQGHAPSCTLSAGTLPPGVTVDASTCVIAGTPTAAGNFGYAIRLTSSDVQGSVEADGNIVIVDPTPTFFSNVGAQLNLRYAQAFSSLPLVAFAGTYVAQPGDSLRYSALGSLPAGLVLDPLTSAVQGTPTGFGSYTVQIVGTLVRGGVSYPSPPVSVGFDIAAVVLQVSYPACIVAVATPYSCAPAFDDPAVAAGLTFTYSSTDLPAGFTIDPATGVIVGESNTIGRVPVTIAVRMVYPDGSVQNSTVGAAVWSGGVTPIWDPAASDFGVADLQGSSFIPGFSVYAKFTTGVSFGLDVTDIRIGAPGDVYVYALQPYDAGTPLPSWVSIDPGTGHVFGIAPGTVVPQAMFRVQLTTQRNGLTFVDSSAWYVVVR
ncbi:MAG: putative Ig domain-containing protein [Caldimonas sp.]